MTRSSVLKDKTVQPALKTALIDIENAAIERVDPVSDLAMMRTAGNLLRAIGRWVSRHFAAVSNQAGKTFDSVGGTVVGTSVAALLVGGPALGLLRLLQERFPQEFAFVGPLLRLINCFSDCRIGRLIRRPSAAPQ
jgi:hypothetical protein